MSVTDIEPSALEGYDIVFVVSGDRTVVRAYVPHGSGLTFAAQQMEIHHRVIEALAAQRKES